MLEEQQAIPAAPTTDTLDLLFLKGQTVVVRNPPQPTDLPGASAGGDLLLV